VSEPLFAYLQRSLMPVASISSDSHQRQAAVLILLSEVEQPSVLYTRRAQHLRQHPGEVCFPGGMWEVQDPDLLTTALRETHEEIGLPPNSIRLLGRLERTFTRAGIPVTPFVASYDSSVVLQACADELDAIFSVPVADFRLGLEVRQDRFEHHGKIFTAPAYQYQGFEIWGFTAVITAQLLRLIEKA
jgi:8-oxo-dGTP pyrophosphatase MutT (NUDIX family)